MTAVQAVSDMPRVNDVLDRHVMLDIYTAGVTQQRKQDCDKNWCKILSVTQGCR